jgi:hypothetical protein
MNSVIYEDSPHYDIWMRGIMVLPVFFILWGAYYFFTGEVAAATGMLATALLMGALYWAIFPRKYQILDEKLKIVLGGTFAFNVPFDNLELAEKPEGVNLGINFVTTFLSRHVVEIKRKKGMNVNISPDKRDLFLENLNKAIYDWKRSAARVGREIE